MDSGKQGSSSESSSEEQSDQIDQVKEDDESSFVKRSYGCIFCKRGFTNAQALGGHMNIHRKDRALKAKQITGSSSSSTSSSLPSKHIHQPMMTNSSKFYPSVLEGQPSGCSPTDPHGYYQEISEWLVPRWSTETLSTNHQLWGSDLSLQIGPNNELGRRGVDLELRLGHDP